MKKLILTLIFVFAIGSQVKVNALNQEFQERDCFQVAIDALIEFEEALWPMDDITGARLMNDAYADCWCLEHHPACLEEVFEDGN